jgi:prepilin-type N-terminal cleavage/methylation domain-containing protein
MKRLTSSAPRRRHGFSLIELMTVLAVIALLALIAIPRYRDVKRRGYTAAIAADFNTVRLATFNYFADNNTYPPDGSLGSVPPALIPYLPQNFAFSNSHYELDYDVWPSPSNPTQMIVGVTVTSNDQQLVNMVARAIQTGGMGLNVGNGYTFIFAGL